MTTNKDAWYRHALCKVHLDMHCPEWDDRILDKVDPQAIVNEAARIGADGLYFFAKDHYGNCYYNTRIGHKHRCIGSRDLVAEAVQAAQRVGMRLVLYYSVVWDMHAAREHPEWCQRTVENRTLPDMDDPNRMWKWLTLCHNTPYRDHMIAMLRELAMNYPEVDGFHLDMFHLGFTKRWCCYCDTCRALFIERYGTDMPHEASWDALWRDFLDFRFQSVDRCMHDLVNAIHAIRPGIFVTTNYHGSPGFDWTCGQKPVQHSMASSMNTGETYTPAFGELYPGMEGRFLRGINPDKPRELVCWRMNRITDFTCKSMAQLRWEAMTALATGASIMLIDQTSFDGTIDPVAYDRLAELFREVHAKSAFLEGEPLKHVGLYYSQKTRDWYGRLSLSRALMPVVGAYKALVESHIPVAFVFDETVSAAILAEFPVLVLPNVAILDEHECALLDQYVRDGGTLVATFDTSRFDEFGEPLADFRLADLFGVSYLDTPDKAWHYWRGLDGVLGVDLDPRYCVLGDGPAHRVRATTASGCGVWLSAFSDLRPPEHFFSHSVHPPDQVEGSAVYVHNVQKGRVFYLPHPCDADYANDHELPEHRLLLRNMIRAAGHRGPVEVVRAPLNVECIVLRQEGRYCVHLLAYNPTRQAVTLDSLSERRRPSQRMDEPTLFRVELDVREPFGTVTCFNDSTVVSVEGRRIVVQCEDVHDVIVISDPLKEA